MVSTYPYPYKQRKLKPMSFFFWQRLGSIRSLSGRNEADVYRTWRANQYNAHVVVVDNTCSEGMAGQGRAVVGSKKMDAANQVWLGGPHDTYES